MGYTSSVPFTHTADRAGAPTSSAANKTPCPSSVRESLQVLYPPRVKGCLCHCLEGQLATLRQPWAWSTAIAGFSRPLPQNSLLCDGPVDVHIYIHTVFSSHFVICHFSTLKITEMLCHSDIPTCMQLSFGFTLRKQRL